MAAGPSPRTSQDLPLYHNRRSHPYFWRACSAPAYCLWSPSWNRGRMPYDSPWRGGRRQSIWLQVNPSTYLYPYHEKWLQHNESKAFFHLQIKSLLAKPSKFIHNPNHTLSIKRIVFSRVFHHLCFLILGIFVHYYSVVMPPPNPSNQWSNAEAGVNLLPCNELNKF